MTTRFIFLLGGDRLTVQIPKSYQTLYSGTRVKVPKDVLNALKGFEHNVVKNTDWQVVRTRTSFLDMDMIKNIYLSPI